MLQRSYQDILLLIARDRASPDVFKSNSLYRTAPCCSVSVPWDAHSEACFTVSLPVAILHISTDMTSYASA